MTSHDSWIDQDEINNLVNSIEGKNQTPKFGSGENSSSPDADSPNTGFEVADESSNNNEGFIFELGGEDESTSGQEPLNKPQVVQALAEVRNRANRGGLLKSSFQKGPSPLWPDFPPLDDEAPSSKAEEQIDLGTEVADEPAPSIPVERPNKLRKRLEEFAEITVSKFEATGFSITDFSGYQLLQHGNKDTLALSAATSLVTDQINQLSEAVGAPELGSTQISLSDDRWLCLVEAHSSAGGILAQLQLPEPMTSSATAGFRKDLEAVLAS